MKICSSKKSRNLVWLRHNESTVGQLEHFKADDIYGEEKYFLWMDRKWSFSSENRRTKYEEEIFIFNADTSIKSQFLLTTA